MHETKDKKKETKDKDFEVKQKTNIHEITAIAIVNQGLEEAAKEELQEIAEIKDIELNKTTVKFSCKTYDELFKLIYKTQIANKILFFIEKIEFKDDEDLLKKLKNSFENETDNVDAKDKNNTKKKENVKNKNNAKDKISHFIMQNTTFRISCSKLHHLEPEIGEIILENFKDKLKVNLKSPELNLYLHVNEDSAYLGIDFSEDLSKRDYKIFNSPMSLKGTTAFGVLKLIKYKPKDVLLDPFCNSGMIEIEAALYANNISPRYYAKEFPFQKLKIFEEKDWEEFFKKIDKEQREDKLPITGSDVMLKNIVAAKKNAKIAGVEKFIDFRRIDVDWMELKFDEKGIDKIITFLTGTSAHKNLEKAYKEFFYQSEYIIKNKGKVVVLCLAKDLLMKTAKEYFKLTEEKEFYSGQQKMYVLVFEKNK